MASENPNVSKQGTADRRKQTGGNRREETDGRKHLTLTVQLEIIRGLENDESQREVVASHDIGLSTVYDIKKWNGQL